MTFHSILFERVDPLGDEAPSEPPAYFKDLNLDQVVSSITRNRAEYRLEPFFYAPLRDIDAVAYRHEVFRDLEDQALWKCVGAFAHKMRAMRECLERADQLYYKYQKERWFLDAVATYVDAVAELQRTLALVDVNSRGFLAFRTYLGDYVRSREFTALVADATKLREGLAGVAYRLHIQGNRITVGMDDSDVDYAADVEDTFQKFRQGAVKSYLVQFPASPEMNHVEAGILDRTALLHPAVFRDLDRFATDHEHYFDRTIAAFDREIQFYVAYLEYTRRFTAAGLRFCYPSVSDQSKQIFACDTFDLALAGRLIPDQVPVVLNDFRLTGPERIIVVTGPNQGGKTTFARMVGQLHYLARMGCLVPGREARLFLFDRMFTHFEREEDLSNLRGKLQDDLVRIHDTLGHATPNSVVIMNEIFTSTTFRDALFLSQKVLERVVQLDLLCVCVTFVDELASLGETTVSMVSLVTPKDPAHRTYKIVRKPADGRAYAAAIAEKYGLTYERLTERLTR